MLPEFGVFKKNYLLSHSQRKHCQVFPPGISIFSRKLFCMLHRFFSTFLPRATSALFNFFPQLVKAKLNYTCLSVLKISSFSQNIRAVWFFLQNKLNWTLILHDLLIFFSTAFPGVPSWLTINHVLDFSCDSFR